MEWTQIIFLAYRIVIYSTLALFFSLTAGDFADTSLVVFSDNAINYDGIKNTFSAPVQVNQISFQSDIIFQEEEFLYLIGFKENDIITHEHITNAITYCVKKNKFSTITISFCSMQAGIKLHFVFESIWTFKKVKIHTIYQGKHFFSRLYCMRTGDIFDESKHLHALEQLKKFLTNDGYCDHCITHHCEYKNDTKEVVVHLYIKKGKRFVFGSCGVEIISDNASSDKNNIECFIQKKLLHELNTRSYSKDLINEQVHFFKHYLTKKGFLHAIIDVKEHINYEQGTIALHCTITLDKKKEIVFFGHRFFSKKQLLDTILVFDQSIWLIPASLLAEEIIRIYKSKGFLEVEVTVQEEKDRSFFIIKEGMRVRITDIEIKNAFYLNSSFLKKRCFRKLLKNEYYDANVYDEAIALLTTLYYEQGYFLCNVINCDFVKTDQDAECVLAITLEEGKRTYIQDVVVEGYPELEKELLNTMPKNEEIPFSVQLLEKQRSVLIQKLQALEYMHPRIKPVIEQKDDQHVCFKWIIDPGEKMYFGKTIVLGALPFPFSYILSLLPYQEGQLWNQDHLQQSFRSLKKLEIFETIQFLPDGRDVGEHKSVLLKLEVDDRYELRTRAGLELQHVRKYQTFSGLTYKLGGTAFIKNPSNCADQLRFDCDFTRSHREVIAQYKRPWFTTYPFFTTAQVYSIAYDQPGFIGSANDIYTLIQNGFLCGIQKKTPYADIVWNNGFEWMKVHIDDVHRLSFAQAIDFKPRFIDKMIPFFFSEATGMIEFLDNALNPTCGGIGLISLKAMIPLVHRYKDSLFLKILAEQSFFIPLKKVVMALRIRCGHIFYREFSGIMPSERFYLGGSHSLRGYEADLAPPLGIFIDDEGHEHIVPHGGKTMVNGNFELRFPVWKKIGAVIFQDIGALSSTFFVDFKKQHVLAASGFGLRIFTPLGPLRFDIGWRWNKQLPIERSFAWFLTFGQAF